jgi:hypothetical protein
MWIGEQPQTYNDAPTTRASQNHRRTNHTHHCEYDGTTTKPWLWWHSFGNQSTPTRTTTLYVNYFNSASVVKTTTTQQLHMSTQKNQSGINTYHPSHRQHRRQRWKTTMEWQRLTAKRSKTTQTGWDNGMEEDLVPLPC